jgi:hypothetical protein
VPVRADEHGTAGSDVARGEVLGRQCLDVHRPRSGRRPAPPVRVGVNRANHSPSTSGVERPSGSRCGMPWPGHPYRCSSARAVGPTGPAPMISTGTPTLVAV